MSMSTQSLSGRCRFSGNVSIEGGPISRCVLEHFEICSLKSLNITWKIFYQRTLLVYDIYSLLDSSRNDLGRVKLNIIGDLFGDKSRMGQAWADRVTLQEIILPKSRTEVDSTLPTGESQVLTLLARSAPPFLSRYIPLHTLLSIHTELPSYFPVSVPIIHSVHLTWPFPSSLHPSVSSSCKILLSHKAFWTLPLSVRTLWLQMKDTSKFPTICSTYHKLPHYFFLLFVYI